LLLISIKMLPSIVEMAVEAHVAKRQKWPHVGDQLD
jgi:hypothetical protein